MAQIPAVCERIADGVNVADFNICHDGIADDRIQVYVLVCHLLLAFVIHILLNVNPEESVERLYQRFLEFVGVSQVAVIHAGFKIRLQASGQIHLAVFQRGDVKERLVGGGRLRHTDLVAGVVGIYISCF